MCRKSPQGVREMSAVATKRQIEKMVRMESLGWGDQSNALVRICRDYKLPFGTLDNIRTGRAKRIFADVRDAIHLAYLDMCGREVAKWQNELAIQRAKGPVDDDLEHLEREAEDLAAKLASRRAKLGAGE